MSFYRGNIRLTSNFALTPSRALVLSFIILILLAAACLMHPACLASHKSMAFIDALFMATSAVCVTGLTTVDVASEFSRIGQMILLLFVQVGGLGVLLFSSSVLLMFGGKLGLRGRKTIQEFLPGISLTGVARLTKYIVAFVFLCEGIGGAVLALVWVPKYGWFDGSYYALYHSVAALCGAGFSTFPNGLEGFREDLVVNLVVMLLIVIGGFGFLAVTDITSWLTDERHKWRISLHTRVVLIFSLALILAGTAGIAFFERDNPNIVADTTWPNALMISMFESITCRSGGFTTVDIDTLQEETRQLMMFLMFIGGGPGSTAGGIKITTFALLVMATWAQLRGRRDIELGGRSIPYSRVLQAVALTVVAIISVILVTVLLNYFEGEEYSRLLFEAVSGLGTVGLSTGVTPRLSASSKFVLCLSMFVGRVGPLTLASSLISGVVRSYKKLPLGEVIIG